MVHFSLMDHYEMDFGVVELNVYSLSSTGIVFNLQGSFHDLQQANKQTQ